MNTYRIEVYTGPVNVKILSRIAKRAGLKVVSTGTQHLHIDVKAPDCYAASAKMRHAVKKKFGRDYGFGRRDACTLRPKKDR